MERNDRRTPATNSLHDLTSTEGLSANCITAMPMLTKRKENVRQTDRQICIIITDLEIPLLTTAGALHRRTVVPSRSSPTPAIRERGRVQEKLKVRPHSAGQGIAGRDVPTIVVVCRRRPQVRVVENVRYEGNSHASARVLVQQRQ